MQRFGVSYAKAINQRYDRVGSLFHGPFQAIHVDQEEYLVHLSRYIHLNPVAAGLVKRPEQWEFSSYLEYLGQRQGTLPLPAEAAQQEITKQLSDAYDFSAVRSAGEKLRLARTLFELSGKAKDHPAERFVLLRKAMELASDGGDCPGGG
jgi:hypothetical protein